MPEKMLCNAALNMLSVLQVWQHSQLCLSSCFADTVLLSGIAILNVLSLLWTASQVWEPSPSSLQCKQWFAEPANVIDELIAGTVKNMVLREHHNSVSSGLCH